MATRNGELTPKQEAFAQAYIRLSDASAAYRIAYNTENMKPTSVNRKAKECMDNVNIAARISELRKTLADRNLWSREQSVEALKEALSIARDSNNSASMTGAIKELNAMHGYNAPVKIEHKGLSEVFAEIIQSETNHANGKQ